MRVIAGQLRGRQLRAPRGLLVRPTTDRVKEALFSILGAQVMGARVLDLYAGTGALGIEALSRGAAAVTFVEHHSTSLRCLRQNLSRCGITDRVNVEACQVETFVRRPPAAAYAYQVLLADPPYERLADVETWSRHLQPALLAPECVAVLEHATKSVPPSAMGRLSLVRTYQYGDTALSVFRDVRALEGTS